MLHVRTSIVASLAVGSAMLLAATPVRAEVVRLHGSFAAEHGATNPVHGSATARFDTDTGRLTYRYTYSGLSGPVIAAHLHGPAEPGQDAGVIAPIPAPYTRSKQGVLDIPASQTDAVRHGKAYINLHTNAHPDGEARAQLVP